MTLATADRPAPALDDRRWEDFARLLERFAAAGGRVGDSYSVRPCPRGHGPMHFLPNGVGRRFLGPRHWSCPRCGILR